MRLTIEITNAEDMKWLESLPKDHQKSTILQCITIGRIAIQNCNMNVSPTDKLQEMIQPVVQGVMDSIEKRFDKTMYVLGSTTDRLLETNRDVNQCVQKNTDALLDTMRQQSELTNMIVEPIQRKIADVDTNLNRLFSTNASSNVKGKLAEHIIEEQLQTAFPKYEVRNTSKDAQEADFHVATDFGEVLLEMKHYKTTVNKDQIHKFYRDIEKTGSRYAIFQSVHSGISGKRDLEWEVYGENKCIILYHGNATLEPKAIVFSFLFLKALAESGLWRQKDASDFIRVQNDTTRQMVEFYEHAAEELIQLQTRLVNMRNAIFEQKQEIAKSMDVLYKHSMDLELEYKAIIRKLYVDIKQVIGKQKTDYLEYKWIQSEVEWMEWMQTQVSNSATQKMLSGVYAFLVERGYYLSLCRSKTETTCCIFVAMNLGESEEKKKIAEFVIGKSKVELLFPIPESFANTPLIPLWNGYETIKGSSIVLSLNSNSDCLKSIEHRITAFHSVM